MAKSENRPETATSASGPSQTDEPTDSKFDIKDLGISAAIEALIIEYNAQSEVVEGIKQELEGLERYPIIFFENRKKFLYFAYTQTLEQCPVKLKFDVKVYFVYLDDSD